MHVIQVACRVCFHVLTLHCFSYVLHVGATVQVSYAPQCSLYNTNKPHSPPLCVLETYMFAILSSILLYAFSTSVVRFFCIFSYRTTRTGRPLLFFSTTLLMMSDQYALLSTMCCCHREWFPTVKC